MQQLRHFIYILLRALKGGLPQYVSHFPKLTHLKANVGTVDVNRLLRAAPLLKSLDCQVMFLSVPRTKDKTKPSEHLHLEYLKIGYLRVEMQLIRYINTQLKQVKCLTLDFVRTRADVYTEEESQRLSNDLEECTIGMDSFM